jgi:hypothetical protein
MKTLKLIFALFLFSIVFTACSATATAEDDQVYIDQQVQLTGGETVAEIDRERD